MRRLMILSVLVNYNMTRLLLNPQHLYTNSHSIVVLNYGGLRK